MREFVELQGASGASYRFRHWPDGNEHAPIAGNYVVLHETDDGFAILAVDVSNDLSLVRQGLKRAIREHPGHQVYTRLNVSRAVRTAEHDDIVAATKPRRAVRAPTTEASAPAPDEPTASEGPSETHPR